MITKYIGTVLFFFLISGFANAATRYVAKSGGCSHMIGKTCSTASNCGTSFDNACCEIQQGHDSTATLAGDTLEIHAGTYTSTGYSGKISAFYTEIINMGAHITKNNLTIQKAANESYTMDLASTREIGLWIDADGVTVDGAKCINQLAGIAIHRIGCVTFVHGSDGAASNNSTLKNSSNVMSSTSSDLSGLVGFRIEMKGNSSIFSNSISGTFGTGFITMDMHDSSTILNIHHNSMHSTRTSNAATCVIFEHFGGTALVHDNSCITDRSAGSRFAYPRDSEGRMYFWNNWASGMDVGFYLQDADDPQNETLYAFNNTLENCVLGVYWYANSYQAHFRNNIFKCGTAVELRPCGGTGCDTGGIGTSGDTSDVRNNAYTGTLLNNTGSFNLPLGLSTNIASDCSLDSSHHLTSSSTACIGTAMSNPIDQGANRCSFASGSISCGVDMDGVVRGSAWDIGADEYSSGGAPSDTTPPTAPTNLRLQ